MKRVMAILIQQQRYSTYVVLYEYHTRYARWRTVKICQVGGQAG